VCSEFGGLTQENFRFLSLKFPKKWEFVEQLSDCRGSGIAVGIANGYGLDGPGIESR